MLYISAIAFCVLVCLCLLRIYLRKRLTNPLPPGPPADPILGHWRILPESNRKAEVFYDWSLKYGDVISLNVLGKSIIVLNSEKAASELLDKRSVIYSDRPSFPIYERIGWKDAITFLPYGPKFIHQRKLLQQPLAKSEVATYRHMHEEEVNVMLKSIMDSPLSYDRHVHRLSTGIIMNLTYGHRVESHDDEFFMMAERFKDFLREASRPSLLDIIPASDKLPAWFPGAWFIRYIENTKPIVQKIINKPFKIVQDQMAAGKAQPSFTSRHLETMAREGRETAEDFHTLKMVAHLIVGGGTESTWHTITVFFLCMLLNPDAQAKAQKEIDSVVGRGRLPDFTDRDALPYVECVAQESMRWFPVAQLGVPHKVMADDYYEGMRIPKGATVLANARGITWDENNFNDPRRFKPERFLPEPEGDGEIFPVNAVFGWGRRMCPGRYLADRTIWLTVARVLAVFTISKAKDAEGRSIDPDVKFVTGIASHPEPFLCDIRPRDERAARLIQDAHMMTRAS